jgi:undecaprenyl-diphosphatase
LKELFQSIFATLLAWGPWGAFLLSVLDSAGIPIPEGVDFLIIVLAARNPGAGYLAAALAVVGSVIGNLVLYYVGRKGGEEFLDKRTQKGWAKRFRQWFHHYGGLAVFIPVLIPAPLPVKIFVLSAGALGMNRAHFVAIVAVARVVRYFCLAYLGAQMGTYPWQYVKTHAWQLAVMSAGVFVLLYVAVLIKDYLRRRAHHHHLHHR